MIYLTYCSKCGKQGVRLTENWKPRSSNYKSHIKYKVKSCLMVKHSIDSCTDTANLLTSKVAVKKRLAIYF